MRKTNDKCNFEKISIIMHEYDTLREEIIQKNLNTTQIVSQSSIATITLIGVISAVFIANLVSNLAFVLLLITIIPTFIAISGTAILWLSADTRKLSRRIREIERDINKRTGERLLRWENDYGWGDTLRKIPKEQK